MILQKNLIYSQIKIPKEGIYKSCYATQKTKKEKGLNPYTPRVLANFILFLFRKSLL